MTDSTSFKKPSVLELVLRPRPATGLLSVLLASVVIILVALGFEHIGKYHPCPLCLIERYAYYFAIGAGTLGMLLGTNRPDDKLVKALLVLIALGYLINCGIGIYHSGIEWKLWPGPETCSAPLPKLGGAGGLDLSTPAVRCDAAPWRFAGLSFAGWSAVLSLALAIQSLRAARTR